jgi:ABC-type dipeptide/oligopeptide/nickel transport system permease component
VVAFVVDRCVRLVLVLIAITLASFLFLHLIPGDPIAIRLGQHASPQQIALLTHAYGLDQPWWVQIWKYLGALLHGDLGTSIADTQPVAQKLAAAFPATVELTCGAMLVAIVIGIPAGVLAAVGRRSFIDVFTMSAVLVGVSIPVFWLGWMLVYLLAVVPARFGLDLFPIFRFTRTSS